VPVIHYSDIGGKQFEDLCREFPQRVKNIYVDPDKGLDVEDLVEAATYLGLMDIKSRVVYLFKHLYDLFVERDCDVLEINPMVQTKQGKLVAADSRVTIDENAIYRQAELKSWEDPSQQNYKERIARDYNLNYICTGGGNIGVLVNGAGLSMATMDLITMHGGAPANFLDIVGTAEDIQIIEAVKLLNSDPSIDLIFMNIFGGILKCDYLMRSIKAAAKEIKLQKPIVLRMKGTKLEEAKKIIHGREEELNIFYRDNLNEAVTFAVEMAGKQKAARESS